MGTFRPQLGRCIDAAAYAIAATVAPALRWWILRRAALWDRRPSSFEPPHVAAASVQSPLGARGSVVSTGANAGATRPMDLSVKRSLGARSGSRCWLGAAAIAAQAPSIAM